MKSILIVISCLFVSCIIDRDASIAFANNTDQEMYFYMHYSRKNGKTYPEYDDLVSKPYYLRLAKAHEEVSWSIWPTAIRDNANVHIYAFSADTLQKYSWKEVLEQKNYWFGDVKCHYRFLFPEEFEYMGNIY